MYDKYIRPSNNPLRDNLHSTMKAYNFEKERLVVQLSHLHGNPERSTTPMSMESVGDESSSMSIMHKKSQYFHAPNIAASNGQGQIYTDSDKHDQGLHLLPTDRKWKDRRDIEKLKREGDMLKLPVIHSARTKRSEWQSGRNVKHEQHDIHSSMDPLPGIATAQALLCETMKIPSIYDPQRSDTAFNTTTKVKVMNKKVTFADQKKQALLSTNDVDEDDIKSCLRLSKNSERHRNLFPRQPKNQFSFAAKPPKQRKSQLLPPLDVSLTEVKRNPQKVSEGVNEWKSVYSNIVNREARTKALAEILQAVRIKKFENEQALKYGNSPRSEETENSLCNYLLSGEKLGYMDESGQKRKGNTVRNIAGRFGRRSNAVHLQQYLRLRQMSRSQRALDQIAAAEQQRLMDISACRGDLMDKSTPTAVGVTA